ncbi:DUF2865 domain-containing protein [Bradyrhizobium canariense]|uniref:DUF2865 domain-containing protein n=1 Tax=Bradyrhizobium canariense TaxID=255045 RepID=A0A1H2A6E4_9BRAD|nr:DUF2865 domain-containing protein [Bradyrhizobium canariense]SDT41016.1 Protein of unknown function [Bradyrhizobium canariense]
MSRRSGKRSRSGVAALVCTLVTILGLSTAAQAEDFLSALFGAFGGGRSHAPVIRLPFGNEGDGNASSSSSSEARPRYVGGQAYCVRSCDGRYFPITGPDNESKAASCNNFCPASETKLVYGSSIDNAATESGKPYSELPNAFRYRNEIVAGCTCNGKDQFGLAPVNIESDPTLRKGDIVAGVNGLMVAGRGADKRGASLNFSPVSASVRAKYQRVPIVASE